MQSQHLKRLIANRGYTLIELLTAVAVMAVLASVAIPGMQNIVLDNRRVAATNDFVYTMQLARSEAISRNQRVAVCASINGQACASQADWSAGWIMFNDINLDGNPSGGVETILRYIEVKGDLDIFPVTFTGAYTYRPSGRIMGATTAENNGEFVFCDRRGTEKARVIVVANSGRPRLSKTRANGSAPGCS